MSRVNDKANVPEKADQIEEGTGIPKRFRANMADQMLFCMRHLRGGYFHIILSLRDRIDAERLAKSVRLAADAEPLIGCRFVEHWFRPYWERRDDLEDLELFRLKEGPHTEDELNRFITEMCDPRFDTQFKVLLLRSDTDTICLRLNHMIGDGGAGKDLIYILASMYNYLGEDPDYRPWPNLGGDRSYRRIGRQLKLRDKVAILKNFRWPVRELRKAGPGWQLPLPDHGRKRGVLSFLVLPSERGQAIISYAKGIRLRSISFC